MLSRLSHFNLKATRAALQEAHSGQAVKRQKQTGATKAVEQVLAAVRQETNGIRSNIRRRFPTRKDLHKAFGVGLTESKLSVSTGMALATSILHAVAAYPTESAAARIIDARPGPADGLARCDGEGGR